MCGLHEIEGAQYLFYVFNSLSRLNKFLHHLSEAGYRVSRTHFDPMGIRTNAPLMQFKSILVKYSTPTYTGSQSEGSLQTSAWEFSGAEVDLEEDM